MGLAPYGEPKYVDLILEHIIDLKENGSFKLNMEYFNFHRGLTMTSEKFHTHSLVPHLENAKEPSRNEKWTSLGVSKT